MENLKKPQIEAYIAKTIENGGCNMAVDWLKIKTEYINGSISYRELSQKFLVPQSTIRKKAAAEQWTKRRKEQRNKIVAKTEQKTEEKISEALSDEAASKVRIRGTIVRMIEWWLDDLEKNGGITDTGAFRRIVQCCSDAGLLDASEPAVEDDGLLVAFGACASVIFGDGDDSDTIFSDERDSNL